MKKSALYKHRPKFKKRDSSTPVYGRTSQYSTTFKKRINQSLADFKPVEVNFIKLIELFFSQPKKIIKNWEVK